MASAFVWPWDGNPDLQLGERSFQVLTGPHSSSSSQAVEWIDLTSGLARSGIIQLALFVALSIWVIGTAFRRQTPEDAAVRSRASRVRPAYEITAQFAQAIAIAFLATAAFRDPAQWPNVVTVSFAFLLSLGRLSASLKWRHTLLHQVNTILTVSLILLLADYLLPRLKAGIVHELEPAKLGSVCALGAAVTVAVLTPREWTPPIVEHPEHYELPEFKPNPEETCNWFARYVSFSYMSTLIWTAWNRDLTMDDLFPLPWYDDPLVLLPRVMKAREKHKTTLRTIFAFQGSQVLFMCLWVAASNTFQLLSPFAMYQLLEYIDSPEESSLHPAIWLFLLFLGPILKSLAFQQYIFLSTRLLVRCKSAMTQELYHRSMSCMELEEDVINSIATRGAKEDRGVESTSAGRLANLMASDLDAVFRMRDSLIAIVGVPVSVVLTGIALYQVTGWPGLLGMLLLILSIPIPVRLAKLMGSAQRKIKLAQDSRISLITEYLGSIKAIKYFAWEDAVVDRVQGARASEQKQLWRLSIFGTLIGETADLIPTSSLLLIFGLYVGVLKQSLTASVAFTTVTLINTMRRNLSVMSWVTRNVTDGFISLDRLDRFFASTEPLTRYPKGPLRAQNATFRRSRNAMFRLRDISVDFVEGGLNVVSGPSGSGKTTLLLALLGELVLESGTVTSPGDVAFASQSPWLQNETIRDNILFNSPFEQVRYNRIIEACCFGPDLADLSKGDLTEIGENGTILSGGQKSRVALARALYSKSSVIFLDDIFSALDAKTAAAVWKLCFCSDLLKERTIVLVTQVPWIPPQADLAISMEDGRISNVERNIGVTRKPIMTEPARLEGESSNSADPSAEPKPAASEDKTDQIADEMEAAGRVSRWIAVQYLRYYGGPIFLILMVAITLLTNVLSIGTMYWLTIWVEAYRKSPYVEIAFYVGIYAAVNLVYVVADGLQYLTFTRGAWNAARQLHLKLLQGVMGAPLSWWKNIPMGRVVNRFSRDIKSLDNSVGDMVYIVADTLIRILFSVGAASSILPIFMLPALISVLIGVLCGEMYTRAGIVLQRILRASHSPVFSQFSDTLTGLTVIRARSDMPIMFCDKLAQRMRPLSRVQEASFNSNRWIAVRVDIITAVVSLSAGIIAVTKASSLGAGLVGFSLSNVSGLSGSILMLVRCLNQLEVEFQGFQRIEEYTKIEPEEKAASVGGQPSNAGQLTGLPSTELVPPDWPRSGSIELRNVTVRYDLDGPDILKDVNLKFQAGERVAIVGRTGSGKSTLVLSLLRFTHITSGQILYDNVDITDIPRTRLRQALTIIPQEAVLFNGTLQSNLDPSGAVPTEVLEYALESCHGIASFSYRGNGAKKADRVTQDSRSNDSSDTEATERTPLLPQPDSTSNTPINSGLSLSMMVTAKGENFSHGQRQVLSLCRALIRKSKLMLLDEATASMDYETDRGVQVVLRKELNSTADGVRDRTLVTIAHRLRTIIDYDKVVVMGGGRVLEVGSPRELYAREGQFYDMVKHSGEEELTRLLEGEGDDLTEVGSE